jgi:hypothetical protein
MSLGFIDDIVYGVEGESDKQNVRKLKKLLQGAEEWRRKHGAQFERSKYVLVHFTRNTRQSTTVSSIQVRRISTVQRVAMKAILGCYRTTPTAAMEIEAGLAPAWIRLQTKVLLSGTRMQSLSIRHPIHKWLQCALRTRTASTRHQSILENMLNPFPFITTRIETIEPYIPASWWISKIQVEIASDKKTAKSRHDELVNSTLVNTMTIYTDGSGIMEKIGAAAYNQTLNETAHQHLGKHSEYNVYSAEFTALDLDAIM